MAGVDEFYKEVELKRDLGLFSATMLGVGAIVGAIIFVLIGTAAGIAGPAMVIAFALNGIVALITAMAYAELGSVFPEAGGGYLWVKQALKGPNAFISGWMNWFSHTVIGSFYALTFGTFLTLLLGFLGYSMPFEPEVMVKIFSVIVAIVFIYINFRGASETGKAGNIITVIQLVMLLGFIIGGFILISKNPTWTRGFEPLFPNGLGGMAVAMGLTFIAFEGFEIIVQTGEEIKNPKKNIPRAIFLCLGIVVPIYILLSTALLGGIVIEGQTTWEWLGSLGERGMVEAASMLVPYGNLLLLVVGTISTMAALNATTFSSTRVLFAMGRDNNMPTMLRKVHPQKRTPYISLIASGVLIILIAILLPIETVAAAADIMFIFLFIQVNIAVIRIRKTRGHELDYGFVTPFFPYLPYVGILSQLVLLVFLFEHFHVAGYISIIWMGVGILAYYVYGRQKESTEKEKRSMITEPGEYRIVAALSETDYVNPIMEVASKLSQKHKSEVVALNVIEMPYQAFLRTGKRFIEERIPLLEGAEKVGRQNGVKVIRKEIIARSAAKAITDFTLSSKTNLLLMGWSGQITKNKVARSVPEKILKTAKCVTCVIKPNNFSPEPKKILVVGGKKDYLARLKIADWLATGFDGSVTILSVLEKGDRRKTHNIKKDHFKYMEACEAPIENLVIEGKVDEVLISISKKYDMIIMGPSKEWILAKVLFGSVQDKVANEAECPVLMVKDPEIKIDTFANLIMKKILRR